MNYDEYDELIEKVHQLYYNGYTVNVNPGPPGGIDVPPDDDWVMDEGEEVEDILPADPNKVFTPDQVESLEDGALLVDADGYAFQKRRGEWFMAGAQYGATEFSGKFPAQIARVSG